MERGCLLSVSGVRSSRNWMSREMNGPVKAPLGPLRRSMTDLHSLRGSSGLLVAKLQESQRAGVPGYLCYTTKRFSPLVRNREESDDAGKNAEDLYEVRIIDNDYNTYEEVIAICMTALNVDLESAYVIAWEVDHHGSCAVAVAPLEIAESLAGVIRSIGIEVRVNRVPGCPVDL
jgi:ATP-dependent Clp protease adapter protein ClpS